LEQYISNRKIISEVGEDLYPNFQAYSLL